eukprot:1158606-Rhodomonas_salina.1
MEHRRCDGRVEVEDGGEGEQGLVERRCVRDHVQTDRSSESVVEERGLPKRTQICMCWFSAVCHGGTRPDGGKQISRAGSGACGRRAMHVVVQCSEERVRRQGSRDVRCDRAAEGETRKRVHA